MGTCSLNQTTLNAQINFDQQFPDDFHKTSSTMLIKNNHHLFTLSQSKQSHLQNQQFSLTSLHNNKQHQILSLPDPSENIHQSPEQNSQQTQIPNQIISPFTDKQNILLDPKLVKGNNRNSSVRICGDFLKIKQKLACSQYKVLAKIANKIGELYKVLDKTTSQFRSLQIIKQDKASAKTLHQINLLKKLDHPNIYHLYDVFLKKGFYYIIGQYIQGDNIFCLTRDHQVISEKKLSKIIKQIFQALNYLHYRRIMHRNIKPQTVIFQSKLSKQKTYFPSIKLINFKKAAQISLIKEQVGSYYFMAPEVFIGSHNQKCDIWSVGVILYMLASGQLPFKGDSKQEIQKNVVGKDLNFRDPIWESKSQSLKLLLKQLLQKSPSKRISAQQALNSLWLKEASESDKILMSKNTMKNLLCIGEDSKFKTIIKTYLVKMTASIQERKEMAIKFQSIDKDKSGFIDKAQIVAAYRQIHGQQISSDIDLDEVVEKIDVNNSGLIDFSEFMAAISKVQTLFARERLQKAFEFIDKDGTGQIQISQLIELLNNELQNQDYTQQDEEISDIMKEFDHDGDKTISKSEFIDFFLKIKEAGRVKNASNLKVDVSK